MYILTLMTSMELVHKAENIHDLALTPPDLGAQAHRQTSPPVHGWPLGACGPAGAALAGLSPPQLGGQGGDGRPLPGAGPEGCPQGSRAPPEGRACEMEPGPESPQTRRCPQRC